MAAKNINSLQSIPTFRYLFIPILIEQLFILLLQNMDIVMLSQYSDGSVAAVGLANQIIIVTTMIYGIINVGTTIQLTQLSSTSNYKSSSKVVSHSIYLNLFFTLTLTLSIVIFGDNLLELIQTPEHLVQEAQTYLIIIALGFVCHSIIGLFSSIFKSYAMVRLIMTVNVIINIMNIILNYLVLFTGFDLLGSGVFGVAVATNVSRAIGAVILISYFIKHKNQLVKQLYFNEIDWPVFRNTLYLGIPSAGETISYNLSQLVITGFIASLGAVMVNAKIYSQLITSVVFQISMAISQSAQIIIGKMIGRDLKVDAYNFSLKILIRSTIFNFLVTLLIALLSFYIVPFLTDNPEIIKYTITLVFLSVLWEPARNINILLISSLNVSGDVKFPVTVSILVMWIFVVPMSYIVGIWFGYGLIGIWIVNIVEEWLRALILFIRWKNGRWRNIHII